MVGGVSIFKVYTDGACSGNPGPGGWAYHMVEPWGNTSEASGGDTRATNNSMELTAAIRGVGSCPPGATVEVYSDSQYVVKGMTEWVNGWIRRGWHTGEGKPVANKDLWVALLEASMARTVTWHWVKGHASNELNNRVDALATMARDRYK